MRDDVTCYGVVFVKRRILLILPVGFYQFSKIISANLSRQGYEVHVANDEYPANIFGRIIGKLGVLSVLRYLTLIEYRKKYESKNLYFDVILIIKGRGVSARLIELLRKMSDRIVAYNFDSFLFNPSPLDWMAAVDKYSTFDIKDAEEYSIKLVHLFSALPSNKSVCCKDIDISCIVKNHSQRLLYIHQIFGILGSDIIKYIYIYEPNIVSAFFGFIRHPILYILYFKYINFKPLPYDEFLDVMARSKVTVDYAHPLQTGITIRCFEALSLSTSIITNNSFVLKHEFFNLKNTLHIPLNESMRFVDKIHNFLNVRILPISRNVDQFLTDVIDVD